MAFDNSWKAFNLVETVQFVTEQTSRGASEGARNPNIKYIIFSSHITRHRTD